jgi:hypothetical protein
VSNFYKTCLLVKFRSFGETSLSPHWYTMWVPSRNRQGSKEKVVGWEGGFRRSEVVLIDTKFPFSTVRRKGGGDKGPSERKEKGEKGTVGGSATAIKLASGGTSPN